MSVEIKNYTSWSALANELMRVRSAASLFRGQRDSRWGLVAGIFRGAGSDDKRSDLEPRASRLANRFIELCRVMPGDSRLAPIDADSALVIGQHFGLQTPLLDWTWSPFVASFFAYADYMKFFFSQPASPGKKKHVSDKIAVWEMRHVHAVPRSNSVLIIRDLPDFAFRQKAQVSVFSRISATEFVDMQDIAKLDTDPSPYLDLVCHTVPAITYAEALEALRMMNITYATLFPDHFGAALQANHEERSILFALLSAGFQKATALQIPRPDDLEESNGDG